MQDGRKTIPARLLAILVMPSFKYCSRFLLEQQEGDENVARGGQSMSRHMQRRAVIPVVSKP